MNIRILDPAQLLLIRFFHFSARLPVWPGHAAWELSPLRQCHPLTFHALFSRQPVFQGEPQVWLEGVCDRRRGVGSCAFLTSAGGNYDGI